MIRTRFAPPGVVSALLRDGFRGVDVDRRRRGGGPTYATRMLGRRAVVLGTPEAARLFYDETAVVRSGAVPLVLQELLFGHGAVHGLDGLHHRRRKDLVLDLVSPDDTLVREVAHHLQAAARRWPGASVRLFDELVDVYGGAALTWAGCEPTAEERRWVSRELARIVDGFGSTGPAYVRAWIARRRTDRWLRRRVVQARRGSRRPPSGSPLDVLAQHRAMSASLAAVELGNLVRPTVAVAWLGVFAALRLWQHPEWRRLLATPDTGAEHTSFAHEVRRTTPFVPVLAGRARRATRVDGVEVRRGDRLVLDAWGIDTDPERWDGLDFDPDRFWRRCPGDFEMVPQGGGGRGGHRCPGEDRTVALLAETARALAAGRWTPAPMTVDLGRIPTRPGGGPVLDWEGDAGVVS